MEILRSVPKIDFIGKRKTFLAVSAVLLLVCAGSLLTRGLRYGVDFAGGTVIQVRFQKAVEPEAIRGALGGLLPGNPSVQSFGGANEYLIQVEQSSEDLEGLSKRARDGLVTALGDPGLEVRRVEMVGPKVGKDLRKKGLIATVLALTGILLYVWLRFEFYYSLGGVIALFHDCLVTVGLFSLLGREFDLTGLAAVLTIAGFSINDTIVVFDRVRENMKKSGGKADLGHTMNRSVNETLSRTILTNGTVLAVVVALFAFGGPVIHNFALAMLIGSVAGTYSTVYVASPVALYFHEKLKGRKAAAQAAA